ncbi:MAG: hypothetical protein H6700_09060, partial [Myxococcales bacterium]|nr:hypothetical protein [Myxococcales bacterium]
TDPLAHAIASLRLAARRRVAPALGDPVLLADVERACAATIEAAGAGECRVHRRNGEIVAAVTSTHDERSWFGEPVTRVWLDAAPEDVDALGWLVDELPGVFRRAGPTLFCMLEAAHVAPLLDTALASGGAVDSVMLVGRTRDARAGLGRVDVAARLAAADVTLRRAVGADVAAISELDRAAFSANPEYCWFGANPDFLVGQRAALEAAVGAGAPPWVLERGGRVLGWFQASVSSNPEWPAHAGMGVVLAPELRRRGLLRVAYAVMLEQLDTAGVEWFRGGTSQPAVMKLGLEMGRRLCGVHIRAVSGFGVEHFASWLPAGGAPSATTA